MSPRISLCVIARDEEADIRRCLVSARRVVTERVVVDTGSSDRTVEIAKAEGARVVRASWGDDFAAARNRSLTEASGDWALVLDADEELLGGEVTGQRFREACADASVWGWQLRVRNLSPPGEMVEYSDVFLTRLFRLRPDVRYESRIHEQVTPSILRAGGKMGRLDVTILHHGYARKTAQGKSRARRNVRTLQTLIAERPADPYVHYQLGCAFQAAGNVGDAETALRCAQDLDLGSLPADVRSGLLLRLSQIALHRRQDREAAKLASESLSLDPDNTVALQVLAVASVGAGDVMAGYAAFLRLRERPDLRAAFVAEVDQMIAALADSARPR